MYLLGILCLVAVTAALPVLPDPPTVTNSVAAAHQGSEMQIYNQHAATASVSLQDIKDNDEVKNGVFKIGSVIFPPPPQLQLFDYSILRKLKVAQKQKYEDTVKQKCEDAKKETVFVISGKPVKVKVPANPAALIDSVTSAQDSELCSNIFILATDSTLIANKKDDKEVEPNMVKVASIVIPDPPELSVFDYSILEKQLADQKQKLEEALKQEAEKSKKVKDVVILDQENPVKISVQPNPATLTGFVPVLKNSDGPVNIIHVGTDSVPVADENDDEKVEHSMAKIATIVIPSPPELPPFDYSILRQQKADYNLKSEYSSMQAAEHSKKEKEVLIVDLEEPVKVEVPANPTTLIDSVTQDSEVSALVPDKKDDEEIKPNMVKIASIVIPAPPELSVFDYSILEKQLADQKLKLEETLKQEAEKSKKEKDVLIVDLEEPVKVEVPANPTTLIDSVTAAQVSEVSALVADKKDDEEIKPNMVKIASIVIPAPPELSVFDYSILEKQLADQKLKLEETLKQEAEKSKKVKEVVILDQENPAKVSVRPDTATLTGFVPVLKNSEGRVNIIDVGTDSVPVADENDDEKVEHSMAKIATIVIPSPPELPPFDYSILRQQKADYNLKSEYSSMQAAEHSKKEKVALVVDLEEPIKVDVPANPTTLIDSVTQDSEVSALVPDKKDDEEVKHNTVQVASIIIPAPPELSVFDYSILEKRLADQKLKLEETLKQEAEKSKKVKEVVILDQENPAKVSVRPDTATLTGFVPVLKNSEGSVNIIDVGTDSVPVADENDDEKVEHSMAKIATIVIPSPPELPPFDYSILRQQKADYNLKSEYSSMQAAEHSKKEKVALVVDLEEPIKVDVPANPTTLIDSVTQDSEVSALVPDKKDDEEVKHNTVASIIIPAPPELSVFDYSILEKRLADQKQKSEEALNQEAEKCKKVEEALILHQEKSAEVEMPVNKANLMDSVTALQKDDEEGKNNVVKIATVIIPSPPELPPFDYSILKNHKVDQKQISDHFLKLEAEKSKKEKNVLIIEEPVEVKEPKLIEESQFVRDSKPIEESKPVEEYKLIEVLKKEPVKHLEDIPIIIQWTITSAPLLSKLISNYPPLPSFGLNWPLQRPLKSGIIDPKFNLDG